MSPITLSKDPLAHTAELPIQCSRCATSWYRLLLFNIFFYLSFHVERHSLNQTAPILSNIITNSTSCGSVVSNRISTTNDKIYRLTQTPPGAFPPAGRGYSFFISFFSGLCMYNMSYSASEKK